MHNTHNEMFIMIGAAILVFMVLVWWIYYMVSRARKAYEALSFEGYYPVSGNDPELEAETELLQQAYRFIGRNAFTTNFGLNYDIIFRHVVKKRDRRGNWVHIADFKAISDQQSGNSQGTAAFCAKPTALEATILMRSRFNATLESLLEGLSQSECEIEQDLLPAFAERFRLYVESRENAQNEALIQNSQNVIAGLLPEFPFSSAPGKNGPHGIVYIFIAPQGWAIISGRAVKKRQLQAMAQTATTFASRLDNMGV